MNVLQYRMPSYPKQDGANGHFMVVLAEGGVGGKGDYAAYAGIVALTDLQDTEAVTRAAEWVAYIGGKLRAHEAVGYFPSTSETDYRA